MKESKRILKYCLVKMINTYLKKEIYIYIYIYIFKCIYNMYMYS